ncbi:MAG: hypothetical protein ACRD3T_12090 [Terriglobia bacterium]
MDGTKAPAQRRHNEKLTTSAVETETLNFRVTSEFKKKFKGYAVSQGITMVELLKEGFEHSKRNRQH